MHSGSVVNRRWMRPDAVRVGLRVPRSSPRRWQASFDLLEKRELLAAVNPTVAEQYALQILNRARANPTAEVARLGPGAGWEGAPDLNEGLPAGTISPDAKQPLAWNPFLGDAARKHSQWMLDNQIFAHNSGTAAMPIYAATRVAAAGGGDIGVVQGVGENLARTITRDTAVTQDFLHQLLFVDQGIASRGHRGSLLNGGWNEVGLGVASGRFQNSDFTMLTENFGNAGKGSFLTGVAIKDLNNNQFYDPGEGLGGVTITATRSDNQVFTATTWDAGGYSLKLDPGTYVVTASGGDIGTPAPQNVTIGTQNVAVDFLMASAALAPPAIVTQPQDTTPFLSQTTGSFSFTATGNPTPTVQWQVSPFQANTFTDIPGGTAYTLSVPKVSESNGNQYRAILTNSQGTVTSNTATLYVQRGKPLPINVISSPPATQVVNVGDVVTLNVVATGYTRLQWGVTTDNGRTIKDLPGETNPTLTFTADASMTGNQYTLTLGNFSGSRINFTALTVNAQPAAPVIVAQTQAVAATAGNTATLSVVSAAFPQANVQWQVLDNGGGVTAASFGAKGVRSATGGRVTGTPRFIDLQAASQPTITIPVLTVSGTRTYRAVISNGLGTVVTKEIKVTANHNTPLANDRTNLHTAAQAALAAILQCKQSTGAIIARLTADLRRLHAPQSAMARLKTLAANEASARGQLQNKETAALLRMERAAVRVDVAAAAQKNHPGNVMIARQLQSSLAALKAAADSQTVPVDATKCRLAISSALAPLVAVAPTDSQLQNDLVDAGSNSHDIGQQLQAPMTLALGVVTRLKADATV